MLPADNQGQDRPTIFVSYCHRDEVWKHLVVQHLRVLEPEGAFEVWEDRRIAAGADWLPEITEAIDRAAVAVLLVSADFLGSRFVLGEEVPRLLERRAKDGLRIVPLVVRPCAWQRVGWISTIQCRPKDGAALSGMREAEAEATLSHFALEVSDLLSATRASHEKTSPALVLEGAANVKPVPPAMASGIRRTQGVLRLDQIERRAPKLLAAERPFAVAAAIEAALPLPLEDLKPFGIAAWAIDYYLNRSADAAEREFAAHLRTQVLSPLREHVSPPRPDLSHWAWRQIPAGSFNMGGSEAIEQPVHDVTVSPFYLGACTVTNKDFRRLMKAHEGEDDLPAVNVDWHTAYAYAAWLGGRLPTEAEWEYACRAGAKTAYSSGNAEEDLRRVGWYKENSKTLCTVGELEANHWGLHDMHGNTWEWMADWYGPYSKEPQVDPRGPAEGGGIRVLRGGCYLNDANSARAASRGVGGEGGGGQPYISFRVALTADPES
jgi:hypothetical protein